MHKETAMVPDDCPYSEIELSIIMPCLNEAKTVGVCVRKANDYLRRTGIRGEVIVADNGSSDGSQEIAFSAGARVISVPARGYGAAIMGGVIQARGKYAVMGDSDDSYDFEALDSFIAHLRDGALVVMGNRFKGGIAPRAMPLLHRYLGTPVISFIGRLFFRLKVGDFNCGLRGFSRAALLELRLSSSGMEFASEMIVKAALFGYRIDEVPTVLRPDGRGRPPHLRSWRDGWRHLRFLLMLSPRWLFFIPGCVLWMIGSLGCAILGASPVAVGGFGLDIHTMLYAGAASIVGLQMMYFGVFARLFGTLFGPFRPHKYLGAFLKCFTLERGLLVAMTAVVLGLGLACFALFSWSEIGFSATNPRHLMRITIPSVVLIVEGVETIMASFFLSILDTVRADRSASPVREKVTEWNREKVPDSIDET